MGRKTKKRLKKCPECEEGSLHRISLTRKNSGYTYSDEFFECDFCPYRERIKKSGNRMKEYF